MRVPLVPSGSVVFLDRVCLNVITLIFPWLQFLFGGESLRTLELDFIYLTLLMGRDNTST